MNKTANGENKPPLKPLELKVLKGICQQKTSRQIARELNLSAKSIDRYRSILFNKIDVDDSKGLVMYAMKHNLFPDL